MQAALTACALAWGCGTEQPATDEGPCAKGQNPERWRVTIGGAGKDEGAAVAMRADGSLVVAGSRSDDGTVKGWTAGISATGATLWEQKTGATTNRAIGIGDAGALVVSDGFHGVLFDSSGKQLWNVSWAGAQSPELEPPAAVLPVTGGFIVVGERASAPIANASRKARLLKVTDTGQVSWEHVLGADGKNTAAAIAATKQGFVTVGYAEAPISDDGRQVWVRAADDTGDKLWEKRHGGPLDEIGVGVSSSSDGTLMIAASTRSKGAGENDLWLLKTSAQGELLWDKTWGERPTMTRWRWRRLRMAAS